MAREMGFALGFARSFVFDLSSDLCFSLSFSLLLPFFAAFLLDFSLDFSLHRTMCRLKLNLPCTIPPQLSHSISVWFFFLLFSNQVFNTYNKIESQWNQNMQKIPIFMKNSKENTYILHCCQLESLVVSFLPDFFGFCELIWSVRVGWMVWCIERYTCRIENVKELFRAEFSCDDLNFFCV